MKNIRKMLKHCDLPIKEVAEKTGFTPSYVSIVLGEKATPSPRFTKSVRFFVKDALIKKIEETQKVLCDLEDMMKELEE
jgi:hypothetical protein